jgi:hypothetical protein
MKTITVFTDDESVKISVVIPFLNEDSPEEIAEWYKEGLLATANVLMGVFKYKPQYWSEFLKQCEEFCAKIVNGEMDDKTD